jgi:hypothetical protein
MTAHRFSRVRTTAAAVAAVAVLLLAACGGSDDTSSGTDGGNGSSSNGSNGMSGNGMSGGSVPRVGEDIEIGGFKAGFEDCSKLAGAYGAVSVGAFMDLFGGGEEEPADFGDVSIPSELADDFRTLENAYAELNAQLGGRSLLDVISDPELAEELDRLGSPAEAPEVQQANENIFKFLEENCTEFVPLPGR